MKLQFDVKKLLSKVASIVGCLVLTAMAWWWVYAMSFFFIDGMRIADSCSTTGYFTLLSIGTFECKPVELVGTFNQYAPK